MVSVVCLSSADGSLFAIPHRFGSRLFRISTSLFQAVLWPRSSSLFLRVSRPFGSGHRVSRRFPRFSLQVNATRSLSDALPLTSLPRSAVPSRFFAMLFPRFSALLRFNGFRFRSMRFLLTAFFASALPRYHLRVSANPCYSDSDRGVRCVSLARHSAS